MKSYPLLLTLIFCGACNSGNQSNKLIAEYIKSHANDPSSYESVSFSKPRPLTYGDVAAGQPDEKVLAGGGILIEHTFRAKNSFGALVLQTEEFVVDSADKHVQPLKEMQDKLEASTKAFVDKQVKQMEHVADSMADARGGY